MVDDPCPIEKGSLGTIRHVGGGVINVKWDNGRDLGLVEGVDEFVFIDKCEFMFNERTKDLFAYFPEQIEGDNLCLSYSHIGQHSVCHRDYYRESRKATKEEYNDLYRELLEIGYEIEVNE
jgi:hypothetical protein